MKKLLLSLLCLGAMCMSASAETSTLTLTSKQDLEGLTSSTSKDLSTTVDPIITWNFSMTGNGILQNFDGTKGLQFGSGSAPISTLVIKSTGFNADFVKSVKSVTVNTSGAKSVDANMTVKVGETYFTTGANNAESYKLTNVATDVTFDGNAKGEIEITYVVSDKAIYVKSITVEYEENSNLIPVELKWDVDEATANLGEDFSAPALTVTPEEALSEVKYDSSDKNVAYFNENNILVINATGETTISASISNSQTYKNASTEYVLNVEDPNAPKPDYIVDELTMESFTSISDTKYDDYFCTSTVTGITYYAQMASGNNSIQLRSKNSNSGIVVTENNNKYILVSVEVEWNSSTSIGNELDFYGKETGYVSPSNLYSTSGNTEQGTELGKVVYGTSTSLEIENPYEFIGMRSKSGAIYINKITLKWKKAAPVAPEVPALSIDGNELADDSYTTSNDSGSIEVEINVPEGHEVYYKLEETAANVATYAAEEGYTPYTGPITVSGSQTLSYYAVNTATGVKSATREIAFHIATGIEGVEVDAANGVVEYFNLQGVKVEAPANGLYIRRQGAKVEKVIVK